MMERIYEQVPGQVRSDSRQPDRASQWGTNSRRIKLGGAGRKGHQQDGATRGQTAHLRCEEFAAWRNTHPNVLHKAMGIVVSQDGGVRFIRWSEGVITYWNHEAMAP